MTRRSRRIVWGGVALAAGFVLWRAAVILNFRAQGTGLVADAAMLPREYGVGAGRPLRMVVLGDSTAAGVGASRLETTLPYRVALGLGGRVSVTNLAVSGATLTDVVRDQLPRLSFAPDVAIVSVSANDATHGTDASAFERELRTLLDGLRARGARRVALSTTPNFRTTPALPLLLNRLFERRAEGLTQAIRRVSAGYAELRLADLNREGTLTEGQYAPDGFHPNDGGYANWAEAFINAIGRL